nr:unnamed protein product [Callosobruchus chinensis]CAH7759600.1 unnamed protein product [Callosobruchus chinensis]
MIALDNEPLSMVDRVGFNRLMHKAVRRYKIPSRTFMTEKIVPDIYDRINKKMMENISEAGLVYENKRNRLLPKNAENLVFIHHNLPLVNYDY